jgi:hypothetical protein
MILLLSLALVIIFIVLAINQSRSRSVPEFDGHDIFAATVQTLESLWIIENSKDINTIESRIEYIKGSLTRLSIYREKPYFHDLAQTGINRYRKMHPGRTIDKIHLEILESAHKLIENNNYNDFWAVMMSEAFERILKIEGPKIELLKTTTGKIKRYEKILAQLDATIEKSEFSYPSERAGADLHNLRYDICNRIDNLKTKP